MAFRIGLFIASLTAALGLAAALSLAGLLPGSAPAETAAAPSVMALAASVPDGPIVQVDTVYLVTPPQATVVVKQPAAASGGGESESEGDDD